MKSQDGQAQLRRTAFRWIKAYALLNHVSERPRQPLPVMLASLACAPRRLACRYWAGRVALRESRALRHSSHGFDEVKRRGNRHHTRHLLNQEFIQALLLHFREHGKKAIEKVAREQPASYLKILSLLVPREHKVEHSNPLKDLTDEQLEAMIEYIETSLAAQAGAPAKMIEGTIEP